MPQLHTHKGTDSYVDTMCTQCAHNVHSCGVSTHVSRRSFFFVFSVGFHFFTWKKAPWKSSPFGSKRPNSKVRNHANGHCGEVVACRGRTSGDPSQVKKNPWDRLGYPWIADFLARFARQSHMSTSWVPQSTSTHQGHQCHKWWFGDGLWHWV